MGSGLISIETTQLTNANPSLWTSTNTTPTMDLTVKTGIDHEKAT
jgi:hypothetical protein